jgi:hypothetical protein
MSERLADGSYRKTEDEHFTDWESWAFGFGYGTGEPHTLTALKEFFALVPAEGGYDYQVLEAGLTPTVAWLLINALCRFPVDVLEYGTSPRYAWLTAEGRRLKAFVDGHSIDDLVALTSRDENYTHCGPDYCNCGPDGYQKGRICPNPFWKGWPGTA